MESVYLSFPKGGIKSRFLDSSSDRVDLSEHQFDGEVGIVVCGVRFEIGLNTLRFTSLYLCNWFDANGFDRDFELFVDFTSCPASFCVSSESLIHCMNLICRLLKLSDSDSDSASASGQTSVSVESGYICPMKFLLSSLGFHSLICSFDESRPNLSFRPHSTHPLIWCQTGCQSSHQSLGEDEGDEDVFTFSVCGESFVCHLEEAFVLSGTAERLFFREGVRFLEVLVPTGIDSTTFVSSFSSIFWGLRGFSIPVSVDRLPSLISISVQLNNSDLLIRLLSISHNLLPQTSDLSRLSLISACPFISSSQHQPFNVCESVDSVASRLTDVWSHHRSDVLNLSASVVSEVLQSSRLQVESEDWLFDFISDFADFKSDSPESVDLFRFLKFENLSSSKISEFFDRLRPSSVSSQLWISLKDIRIRSDNPTNQNRYSRPISIIDPIIDLISDLRSQISPPTRTVSSFSPTESGGSGLFNHLRQQMNGQNPHLSGLMKISASSTNDNQPEDLLNWDTKTSPSFLRISKFTPTVIGLQRSGRFVD